MLQGQPAASDYDIASSCIDDAALVTGLQRGDPCSIEYVVQHYAPALYRFAYYQLQDAALAEDVVSEVMVRMIERVNTFRLGRGAFQSWLFRIARNLLADYHRTRGRRPEISLEQWLEADPASEPGRYDSQMDFLPDRQQIEAGLATLTCEQREVILLHVVEGWELPQVAELLDRSVASIKGLYYRGIQSLRRALECDDGEDDADSRVVFIDGINSKARRITDG
jgi:RNA polymerase sigma-70 factor (ECF subfamily)